MGPSELHCVNCGLQYGHEGVSDRDTCPFCGLSTKVEDLRAIPKLLPKQLIAIGRRHLWEHHRGHLNEYPPGEFHWWYHSAAPPSQGIRISFRVYCNICGRQLLDGACPEGCEAEEGLGS